jgi:hypothetical protein
MFDRLLLQQHILGNEVLQVPRHLTHPQFAEDVDSDHQDGGQGVSGWHCGMSSSRILSMVKTTSIGSRGGGGLGRTY